MDLCPSLLSSLAGNVHANTDDVSDHNTDATLVTVVVVGWRRCRWHRCRCRLLYPRRQAASLPKLHRSYFRARAQNFFCQQCLLEVFGSGECGVCPFLVRFSCPLHFPVWRQQVDHRWLFAMRRLHSEGVWPPSSEQWACSRFERRERKFIIIIWRQSWCPSANLTYGSMYWRTAKKTL